jgi:hypothetical protein
MQKYFSAIFFILPPGLVLLFFSYIGTFSRLMADDFCSLNDARRFKMLRYIWHWYNNWGGRYSAIATDDLLSYIGALGVRFVPFVVLFLCVIGVSVMCHKLLQKTVSKDMPILISVSQGISLVFAIVAVSPDVQTVLYWWNGMRTYMPPFISITFHLAYLFWAMDRLSTRRNIILGCLFSFWLALFSGGYNETFTTVQFLFFVGLTGLYLFNRRLHSDNALLPLFSAAALGSALSLIIMAVSPGAARRMTFFPPHPDFLSMIEITTVGYLAYISEIFNSPEKVTALLGVAFVALWIGTQAKEKMSNGWLIPFAIIVTIALSFASLVPSVYGLSKMPAPRTFVVPTFVIILGFGYIGLMIGKWISTNTNFLASPYTKLGLLLCAVVLISFSSWVNTKTLYENRVIYSSFAEQWDQVDAMIRQAKLDGNESITIPAMDGWAHLDRPNGNPKFWATACYSTYYEIQVVGPPYGQ